MTVIDAVLARLTDRFTAANTATTDSTDDSTKRISVYDGDVPANPTSRYVVVWSFSPRLDALSVDGEFRDYSGTFQVTAVAFQPDGVGSSRPVVERLLSESLQALSGWKPSVAGLNCHPVEPVEDQSQDTIARDDSVADRQVMYGSARFRWAAELPI